MWMRNEVQESRGKIMAYLIRKRMIKKPHKYHTEDVSE